MMEMKDLFDPGHVDRRGTDCLKYDFAAERGQDADVLPLWVADMDFPTVPAVAEALSERALHGVFGYTEPKDGYYRAAADWFERHYGWRPERSWFVKTPGVVFALAMAVRAYTREGDAVLIQQPVYYPFREVIETNGRRLADNELVLRDGRYEMDLEDLERKLREERVRLMFLCSPHNPVGRVWSRAELEAVAELCVRYDVILAADEIHCDFVFPGHTFVSTGTLGGAVRERLLICTAPSKTFNLAGLQDSNIFVPNTELRRKLRAAITAAGYSQLNTMGLLACRVAYEEGEEWLRGLNAYLYENLLFLKDYLERNLSQVRLIEPEGTYLAWLDFGATGLSGRALDDLISKRAKLWLDGGSMFGGDSGRFQRINIACRRELLAEALDRLVGAVRAVLP